MALRSQPIYEEITMAIPGLGSGPAIMASTVETVLISCSEYAI
jgi:hypothetical protein